MTNMNNEIWCETIYHAVGSNTAPSRIPRRAERTSGLSKLANVRRRETYEELGYAISELGSNFYTIHRWLREVVSKNTLERRDSLYQDIIKECRRTVSYIEDTILANFHPQQEGITINLRRMADFIKKAIPQLERISNISHPTSHDPVSLLGRS